MLHLRFTAVLICLVASSARGADETITLATYNIEHFQEHFSAFEINKKLTKEQKADPNIAALLATVRKANDEDNWETSMVITAREMDPDILVIQEGCTQDNLEYFNKRWLRDAYATVITFPTNTGIRDQHLNMMLKPGFKVLKRNDQYHLEKDAVERKAGDEDGEAGGGENGRGFRLFARGPAFVLVETPGGYKFWVGTTHQKSKRLDFDADKAAAMRRELAGQPRDVIEAKITLARAESGKLAAEWRNREAKRTHEIMKELAAGGESDDVILLGDMNDDVGMDEHEKLAGADAIDLLVGPPADGFLLVTKPLVDQKEISFGGYYRPDYRSLIDHAVATPAMKDQIAEVRVHKFGLARVASDHYPVVVKVKAEGK